MLQRSIIQPITGTIRALATPPTDSANEAVPRCQPISAMIGFRNTPKVKARTGPLQTNNPVTEPTTTHHGLLNLIPMTFLHRAAGHCTRLASDPIASRSVGRLLMEVMATGGHKRCRSKPGRRTLAGSGAEGRSFAGPRRPDFCKGW